VTVICIGTLLHGYCNGFFPGDNGEPKVIEMIGPDWVVVRDSNDRPLFASFHRRKHSEMISMLEEWAQVEGC